MYVQEDLSLACQCTNHWATNPRPSVCWCCYVCISDVACELGCLVFLYPSAWPIRVHTDVCWCSTFHWYTCIHVHKHLKTSNLVPTLKFLFCLSACVHSSRWETTSSPGARPRLGPCPARHGQLPWGQPTAALLCGFPCSASCCRWGGSPPRHSHGTSGGPGSPDLRTPLPFHVIF